MSIFSDAINGIRARGTCAAAVLSMAVVLCASGAHAQVFVNGEAEGVTIQARPVQRTYAQVYSPSTRARLITRKSVMESGGTIPPAYSAVYVQPSYGQPIVASVQSVPSSGQFRLDPYASKRYGNVHYSDSYRFGGRTHYAPWYGYYSYQYAPGFYYYWRPSFHRYGYHYRSHRYSSCGPRYSGGSYVRFSSSSGLNIRLRF